MYWFLSTSSQLILNLTRFTILSQDTNIDYEVDSEEEWVEPEQECNGESCLSGDDDVPANGNPDEDDSNDDGFFVPAGYMSNEDLGDKASRFNENLCI